MTSSLVGSEMCIRDSIAFALFRCASGNTAPLQELPAGLHHTHPMRLPVPVSYTHLTLPTICSV
eukprot:851962-Prorocentrum_lima.AAC.1